MNFRKLMENIIERQGYLGIKSFQNPYRGFTKYALLHELFEHPLPVWLIIL